ncbi:MAG: O-antigen ligase family protein [Azoarcus sp.]|nr:O-antigen ligase family protein [Azoarcus sp.]
MTISAFWGEGSMLRAAKDTFFMLCLALSADVITQNVSERILIKSVIIIGGVIAACYIGLWLQQWICLPSLKEQRFTIQSINRWGNDHAINTSLLFGIPIIASWYFFSGKAILLKLLLVATMMLCGFLMVLSKSRGPLLSAMLVLFCISLYRRKKEDFLFMFISVGVVFLFFNYLDHPLLERFKAESYRFYIWNKCLHLFKDYWLFGQGYGTSAEILLSGKPLASHAHNTYLEILRIGGIVGGVLFIYMIVTVFRFSYIHAGNRFFLYWMLFGALCMVTNGRLPLLRPSHVIYIGVWIPFFLFYFSRNRVQLMPLHVYTLQNEKQSNDVDDVIAVQTVNLTDKIKT